MKPLLSLIPLAFVLSCTNAPVPEASASGSQTTPTIPVRSPIIENPSYSPIHGYFSSKAEAMNEKPSLLNCYREDTLMDIITIDIDSASFYALTLDNHDTIKLWYPYDRDSLPTLNFTTLQPLSFTQDSLDGEYRYSLPFHPADGYCFLSRLDFPYPLTSKDLDGTSHPLYAHMWLHLHATRPTYYFLTESRIVLSDNNIDYYWYVQSDEKTKFLNWLISPPPPSLNNQP